MKKNCFEFCSLQQFQIENVALIVGFLFKMMVMFRCRVHGWFPVHDNGYVQVSGS